MNILPSWLARDDRPHEVRCSGGHQCVNQLGNQSVVTKLVSTARASRVRSSVRTEWPLAYWRPMRVRTHGPGGGYSSCRDFFVGEQGGSGWLRGGGSRAGVVLHCPNLLTKCLQTTPAIKKELGLIDLTP